MGKIRGGQMPSAREWNRHVDVADWWSRTQRLGDGDSDPIIWRDPVGSFCRIRNSSADDVDKGRALGIGGVAFEAYDNFGEFLRHPVFEGVEIARPTHHRKFVVALEPIKRFTVGVALVSGYCQAWVDVKDAAHTHARVTHNEQYFTSANSGPLEILHMTYGDATKQWCLVRTVSASSDLIGKLDADLADCTIGTLSVYEQKEETCPPEDTGTNVQVLNISSYTLEAGPLMQAKRYALTDQLIVFPIQITDCAV